MIRRLIAAIFGAGRPKVVVWTREPMSREQMAAALANWGAAGDARLAAILQLVEEHVASAASEVSAPALADRPGLLAHTAGGKEYLEAFQAELYDFIEGNAGGNPRRFKASAAAEAANHAADPAEDAPK